MNENSILIIDPENDLRILKGLGSAVRLKILALIQKAPKNVQQIAEALKLPQSTVATNIMVLEKAGLVKTWNAKGKKGTQKMCQPVWTEVVIKLWNGEHDVQKSDVIEVEMPVGLYTRYHVRAPCGLCSRDSIIGYLDVIHSFLDPARMKASIIWFEVGYLEYKFPNNALYKKKPIRSLELSAELSSEIPGTKKDWLSDITLWINEVEIGSWTSPGDYGDRRGKFTPSWWKLEGSQYGLLKHWRVNETGSFVDGIQVSGVTLADLKLSAHHSITVRIGVKEDAEHVGGINIFGRGFGNYDQDLMMRLVF
jgi:predicted transcriptional regulator